MGTVAKRAASFVETTKGGKVVGYKKTKQPTEGGSPKATVKSLNSGVLKGPTTTQDRG